MIIFSLILTFIVTFVSTLIGSNIIAKHDKKNEKLDLSCDYKYKLFNYNSLTCKCGIAYESRQCLRFLINAIRAKREFNILFSNGLSWNEYIKFCEKFGPDNKDIDEYYSFCWGQSSIRYKWLERVFYVTMQELCDEGKWMVKYDENNNNLIYYPIYNQKSIDNI